MESSIIPILKYAVITSDQYVHSENNLSIKHIFCLENMQISPISECSFIFDMSEYGHLWLLKITKITRNFKNAMHKPTSISYV